MRAEELSRPEHNVAFGLRFDAVQFVVRYGFRLQAAKLFDDEADHLARLFDGGAGVDRERSRVAVGRQLRVDAVGQARVFAHGLEEPRAHAAAQDGIEQVQRVAVRGVGLRRGYAEADLHLLQRFLAAQCDVRRRGGCGEAHQFVGARGRQRAEIAGNQRDHLFVFEIACG